MTDFQSLVGTSFDATCDAMGLRSLKIRYGDTKIITPTPLISYNPSASVQDISSELSSTEVVQQWQVSVPYQTLQEMFGSDTAIASALVPNGFTFWYATDYQGNWVQCRITGKPDYGDGGRVGFTLTALGFGDRLE